MNIIVNGEPYEIQNPVFVNDLLKLKEVKIPDMVAVELNGTILKRTDFETTLIKEDDQVEFLYFMGGGGNET